ncbi:hypothetical protein WJX84_007329 [Apatococcus fuscideae]|uniref:Putative gamma-glutamylcyclotransferase n=1 Tax=Apatococcus fuscideae TaxID=2026836 RepID=A0AAW1S028_9CHLO
MYPALAKATAEDSIEGKVLHGITPHELDVLDEYEDDEYYKDVVEVETSSGRNVHAYVYIWQDHLRHKLSGSWSYEDFREHSMAEYLKIHAPFAEEVQALTSSEAGVSGAARLLQDRRIEQDRPTHSTSIIFGNSAVKSQGPQVTQASGIHLLHVTPVATAPAS